LRAVGLVFWTQLRHRWRSWLAISILIGLVGGVIMAAAAAGRRTESAIPTFVADHGFDAEVYSTQSSPKIPRLPEVSAATVAFGPDNGQPACACRHPLNPSYFGVVVLPTKGRPAFNLVSGRLPDPSNPYEVVASYTLQQDEGVHLGSVFHVPFYAPSQLSAYNSATGAPPKPTGPTVALRVVGFEATEFDFPSGSTPSYSLYASQAFGRSVLPHVATGYVYFVRLHRGATDLPRFDAATSALGTAYTQNEDAQVASVEASVHPQAIGWWLLAALAALVGLVVIGQALGRQSIAESADFPTMVALGVERRQLVMLGTARNLVVGLVGALGAVLVATVLSPISPLGEARVAESSTGINFDASVLILGALATVGAVVVLGFWPAVRAARTSRSDDRILDARPSRLAGHLWSLGAPASVVIGVRNAIERRSGGATVPVGSALVGTVLAVIALCGTAVFGASLSHLTATPKLYGDPFQLNISDPNSGGVADPGLLQSLEQDPAVTRITKGIALPAISINKAVVGAIAGTAIKGHLLLSSVAGHTPDATGEIGLGATTMRQAGARLGSIVHVTVQLASGGRRTVPFRVVGQLSLPVLGNAVSLGSGAVFTLTGYEDAACPPGPQRAACRKTVLRSTNGGVLASVVPGPRGEVTINRYFERYRSLTALAVTPTSLINFGEAVNFPLIFGAILAVFGAATLLHLLVVSVSQRRREVGLLKVVGFVNGQVASTVAWQATTLAVAGIVIGVPTGVVVGGTIWRAFANNLGAVPVSVVPVWLIALLVAGVLVVANLIAVAPALVATRSKPRDLLRTI
jgi:putative ABC transport system permease protein